MRPQLFLAHLEVARPVEEGCPLAEAIGPSPEMEVMALVAALGPGVVVLAEVGPLEVAVLASQLEVLLGLVVGAGLRRLVAVEESVRQADRLEPVVVPQRELAGCLEALWVERERQLVAKVE